ncbi:uncharacterized protein [Aphelocoma coerulescens]|uniref:uncharacterized protein n=1 Tax=Aphelocoma coerulescens TaxID=39617 RepID=UPI003604AE9D
MGIFRCVNEPQLLPSVSEGTFPVETTPAAKNCCSHYNAPAAEHLRNHGDKYAPFLFTDRLGTHPSSVTSPSAGQHCSLRDAHLLAYGPRLPAPRRAPVPPAGPCCVRGAAAEGPGGGPGRAGPGSPAAGAAGAHVAGGAARRPRAAAVGAARSGAGTAPRRSRRRSRADGASGAIKSNSVCRRLSTSLAPAAGTFRLPRLLSVQPLHALGFAARSLHSELVTSELGRTFGAQGELLPLHRLNKPDQNLSVFLILQWKAKERGRGHGQCSRKEDRSRRSPAVLNPSAAAGAPAGALAPAVPAKRSHRSREGGTAQRSSDPAIQRSSHPAIQRSSSSRALPASPECSRTAPRQARREPRPGSAERGRARQGCDSQGLAESIGSDRRRESAGWPWERGTKKLWRPSALRKAELPSERYGGSSRVFKNCKNSSWARRW